MKKILVISNSHGASLKRAFLSDSCFSDQSQLKIDWFIVGGKKLQDVKIESNKLSYRFSGIEEARKFRANENEYLRSDVLTSYDAVFVYGLGLISDAAGKVWAQELDYFSSIHSSEDFRKMYVSEKITSSLNYSLCKKLFKLSNTLEKPITTYSLPSPFTNEFILDIQDYFKIELNNEALKTQKTKKYITLTQHIGEQEMKHIDVAYLPLPNELNSEEYDGFTKVQFKSDSDKVEDVSHLNIDGSAHIVKMLMSVVLS